MIFIKQRLDDILIFDERLEFIKEFKSSSFVVINERILIKKENKIIADLPYSNVGVLTN